MEPLGRVYGGEAKVVLTQKIKVFLLILQLPAMPSTIKTNHYSADLPQYGQISKVYRYFWLREPQNHSKLWVYNHILRTSGGISVK